MDRKTQNLKRLVLQGDISVRSELAAVYARQGLRLCGGEHCAEGLPPEIQFCEECEEYHWPFEDDCDCSACSKLKSDVRFYSWNLPAPMLELHARRTSWSLNYDDPILYHDLLGIAIAEFEERTGTEVFLEGRSGRHVCVHNTVENRRNYHELRQTAIDLEQQLIDSFNSEAGEM